MVAAKCALENGDLGETPASRIASRSSPSAKCSALAVAMAGPTAEMSPSTTRAHSAQRRFDCTWVRKRCRPSWLTCMDSTCSVPVRCALLNTSWPRIQISSLCTINARKVAPSPPDEPRSRQPLAVLSTVKWPSATVSRRATRRLRPRLSSTSSSKSKPRAAPAGKRTCSTKTPGFKPRQRPSTPVTSMPLERSMALTKLSKRSSCENATRPASCAAAKQTATMVATVASRRRMELIGCWRQRAQRRGTGWRVRPGREG